MEFIPEAQAQVGEATKAAVDAGNILLQYQVLGAFCIFLIVALVVSGLIIRTLYNHNQTLHGKIAEIFGKALVAIEASTVAMAETRGTDKALGQAIETLGKALNELSHENEKHDTDVRHGLNNAAFALTGLAEKLKEIGGKLDVIRDFVRPPADRPRRPS